MVEAPRRWPGMIRGVSQSLAELVVAMATMQRVRRAKKWRGDGGEMAGRHRGKGDPENTSRVGAFLREIAGGGGRASATPKGASGQ